jgi:transcriptional regulator with XRE-family HTH domain
MSAIAHIRKKVLGVSQAAIAEMTGVTQATVSRWEKGELSPNLRELAILREAARAKGGDWEDSWFFEPPQASGARAEARV